MHVCIVAADSVNVFPVICTDTHLIWATKTIDEDFKMCAAELGARHVCEGRESRMDVNVMSLVGKHIPDAIDANVETCIEGRRMVSTCLHTCSRWALGFDAKLCASTTWSTNVPW